MSVIVKCFAIGVLCEFVKFCAKVKIYLVNSEIGLIQSLNEECCDEKTDVLYRAFYIVWG